MTVTKKVPRPGEGAVVVSLAITPAGVFSRALTLR